MSQGGSAPRPTSRQSSRSPTTATDTPSRPLHEPGGMALTRGDGAGHHAGTRTLDTRDILNPTGPHDGQTEQSPSFPLPSAAGGHHQSVMGLGHYGVEGSPSRRFSYQGPGTTTPQSTHQTIPSTTSPAGPPTPAGRGSPQTVHPYPMAARRVLTPKSPRAFSLSRAAMRTVEAHHLTRSIPEPTTRGSISAHDTQAHSSGSQPFGAPPQFDNSVSGQGPVERSPTRPTSGLSRSLSQPSLGHGLPPAPQHEPLPPGSLKREHTGRPVLSALSFPSPLPTNRPFGTSGVSGEGSWGSGYVTSLPPGAARNFQMTEGQPLLAITPTHGEEIVVAVDVHQGSRQADQKRQRNAGASARFRQRKKEREKEQHEELQKLENEGRELERKNEELAKLCQDLEVERNFYRSERNRLRDVLVQFPGGKEWVDRGPPSPISRPGGGPYAPEGSGPVARQPPPPPPPPQPPHPQSQHHVAPYHQSLSQSLAHPHPRSTSYGDIEPPARRRRTDSEPQLPTSSYSLMAPAPLPPIASPLIPPPPPSHAPPAFSIPPSPHVTPPPGNARLPPLRFDQARTPSTTPPPIPTAQPPPTLPPQSASPYVTTRKLPYETGWATDARPPNEGGPR